MLRLSNPVVQINRYLSFIKEFYSKQLRHDPIDAYKLNDVTNIINIIAQKPFLRRSKEIELYDDKLNMTVKGYVHTLFLDPITFSKANVNIKNWYEFYDQRVISAPILRSSEKSLSEIHKYVETRMANQMKFMKSAFEQNLVIDEKSIQNYINFIRLSKENPKEKLIPTLEINAVWNGHMLDHETYCRDTKEFLGKILDHDDDHQREKTAEIYKPNPIINSIINPIINPIMNPVMAGGLGGLAAVGLMSHLPHINHSNESNHSNHSNEPIQKNEDEDDGYNMWAINPANPVSPTNTTNFVNPPYHHHSTHNTTSSTNTVIDDNDNNYNNDNNDNDNDNNDNDDNNDDDNDFDDFDDDFDINIDVF